MLCRWHPEHILPCHRQPPGPAPHPPGCWSPPQQSPLASACMVTSCHRPRRPAPAWAHRLPGEDRGRHQGCLPARRAADSRPAAEPGCSRLRPPHRHRPCSRLLPGSVALTPAWLRRAQCHRRARPGSPQRHGRVRGTGGRNRRPRHHPCHQAGPRCSPPTPKPGSPQLHWCGHCPPPGAPQPSALQHLHRHGCTGGVCPSTPLPSQHPPTPQPAPGTPTSPGHPPHPQTPLPGSACTASPVPVPRPPCPCCSPPPRPPPLRPPCTRTQLHTPPFAHTPFSHTPLHAPCTPRSRSPCTPPLAHTPPPRTPVRSP